MAKSTVEIKVSMAWWLKPYLYGVVTVALLMGMQPDWDKVQRKIIRAMRVKIR